jgi:hypothetical protein
MQHWEEEGLAELARTFCCVDAYVGGSGRFWAEFNNEDDARRFRKRALDQQPWRWAHAFRCGSHVTIELY